MEKIDNYFKKARQLPLAMSIADVKSLVQLKGVTSPPKKSWWNLNNFIIMTTTAIISTALMFWLLPQKSDEYQSIHSNEIQSTVLLASDSVKKAVDSMDYVAYEEATTIESIDVKLEERLVQIDQQLSDITANIVEDSTVSQTIEAIQLLEEEIYSDIPFTEIDNESGGILSELQEQNRVGFESVEPLLNETVLEDDEKRITQEISAQGANWFEIENKQGDILIKNSESGTIELIAIVKMKGKNDEDVKKGLEDFEIELLKKGERVMVSHNWSEYSSCNCWPPSKKSKIKTKKGEKIRIDQLEITYEIKLPKAMNLNLKNNYGDIKMGDTDGELVASLFKGNIDAGNIGGDLSLHERYGDAVIGSFENGKVTLFKANAKLGEGKDLKLKANYSDVDMAGAQGLELSSFQSDIVIANGIKDLSGSLRYGDLSLGGAAQMVELTLFKGNVKSKNIDQLKLNASYSDVESGSIQKCDLENAFQSDLSFNKVEEISGSIRYTPLVISELGNSLEISSFQGSLKVKEVNASFQEIDLNSSYTNVNFNFNTASSFSLKGATAYTRTNVDSDPIKIEYDSKTSQRSDFRGSYNKENQEGDENVRFKTFQGSLTFTVGELSNKNL